MQEHQCKNCGHIFQGRFCNECGEKVYHEHDKKLAHLFEEGFHFMTHFEGKFLVSIKTIFTKPGQLSLDYCNGIRKKYFKPLSLFLLLVVIYLLFPLTQGLNMRADFHGYNMVYGEYASGKILQLQQEMGLNAEEFEKVFHYKGEKVSRLLLVILIPLTALWFWAITFKKRPYYFDQVVFSSEVNSVYLLWVFILFPLLHNGFRYLFFTNSNPTNESAWVFAVAYIPVLIFSIFGSYRFYGISKWMALGFGLLFILVHTIIFQFIYKFILFLITISLIH